MQDIKTYIARLSQCPGVYQMLGEGEEVLYVGKAKNLKKRIASYFQKQNQDLKTAALVQQIKNITVTITQNENEAVLLECNLIKKHHPRYNVLLRDDKSYPYILISAHAFPRIDLYRGRKLAKGNYYGPYPTAHVVRETISLLQKIFKIRTCRDAYFAARTRPCLLYQIERCSAPCVKFIAEKDYSKNIELAILFLAGKSEIVINTLQNKMEESAKVLNYEAASQYRDQIMRLRQIQHRQYVSLASGNADVIGLALEQGSACVQLLNVRDGKILDSRSYFPRIPSYADVNEVLSAFLTQHYLSHPSHMETLPHQIILGTPLADKNLLEDVFTQASQHKVHLIVPLRADKKKWLQMATITAKHALHSHLVANSHLKDRMVMLQKVLNLKAVPKRLECFDVSHHMGEATVASCVVFNEAGPLKSDYRRFNIRNLKPGDDLAAMAEVLSRRFKGLQQEHKSFPDAIVIDGGPTQLAIGFKVLNELAIKNILLIAISKGPKRRSGFETLYIDRQAPIHLPHDSVVLHFLQYMRDEAHRFAIGAHRQRRDKARRQSPLQLIAGIGAKRRRELLRYFGGIQGVARASLDELTKVPGISRSLAERIFITFHDETI